jgi:proteasome lid subunit RPN8/RPN11
MPHPARTWARPLLLPTAQARQLDSWARRGFPSEACGLLVGSTTDAADRVQRVEPARNLEAEQPGERFTLAPEDWMRIETRARGQGLQVLGVWHSHPSTPAVPSERDLASAWEGIAYLITPTEAGNPGPHRAWRLAGGVFVEQPVLGQSPP